VIPVLYVENYDMALAQLLCAGVDLWLNTPQPPLEASGTSGMKAALNGVPSLSTLDGWWIEGHVEGVTGWTISDGGATALYEKLEHEIIPCYGAPSSEPYCRVRRSAIALNGSFFNTQRVMAQYALNAYIFTPPLSPLRGGSTGRAARPTGDAGSAQSARKASATAAQ
jgi:starch phosphorylase